PAGGDADEEVGALVDALEEAGRGRGAGGDGEARRDQREGERARGPPGSRAEARPLGPAHDAVTPPSTGRAAPVMNEASSESRKRAALAISSGRPVRPRGTAPAARRRTRSSGSMPAVDF